jgi:4-alpha-glucanotransferase
MSDPGILERLRELRGVGRGYTDYRGRERSLSEQSLRHLLESLGHSTGDDAALLREAAALEERDWVRVLPPVTVLQGTHCVPVTVLAPLLPSIRWRIETGRGDMLSGEVDPARLPVLAERGLRGLWYQRLGLELPPLPYGYHRLWLEKEDGAPLGTTGLVVAPARSFEPDAIHAGARVWGPAIQLYTLRSPRNWGIGDFTDLAGFTVAAAKLGADLVGLNPLHALFPADPSLCSPYSPSSRHFLNVLYIDPEAVPEFADCVTARRLVASPEFQARLAQLRAAPWVDYLGVTACKMEVLREIFETFRAHGNQTRRLEFSKYMRIHGQSLEIFGLFHSLHEHFIAAGVPGGWPAWPEAYHDPTGPAAQDFRSAHPETIEFHCWLQWLAAEQLAAAEQSARTAGMRLGLYRDLAVGPDSGGAETWAGRGLYAMGATVGAPPDPLALQGQDWGIPPVHPDALRERAYEPFVQLLRANMGRRGVLRIDHVMMLFRLWWVPRGCKSADGAYVHYRLDELMAIVALESWRQRCLVVGEDLGTVPPEVRAAMSRLGMYSYRVLIFEREANGRFRRPADYPRQALAAVSTHDLPTLASFWAGTDIDLRERLGLYPEPGQADLERAGRAVARDALIEALAGEGLLPERSPAEDSTPEGMDAVLARAVQCYLARSAAAVLVLQPEDWLGMDAPVNVPGTSASYPNWARKLSIDWPEFMAGSAARALADAVGAARRAQDG